MNWFSQYYQEVDIDTKTLEKFKKFLINNEDDETQILEIEYNKSIDLINELSSNNDLANYLETKNSLYLLNEEHNIIKLLSKYTLQNNYLNFEFFIKCVNLLLEISKVLSKRLELPNIVHKIKNYNNYIPRCSYKFCNFKNECFYNYNSKTKNVCYQDHYVHNMVTADLIILNDYIKSKFEKNNLVIPNKEILKSINTLSYVIEHMHSELKSRCLYLNEDEYEKEHIIKRN